MDSLDLVTPYLFKHKGKNFMLKDALRPKEIDALQDVELRPTDIFISSFPKSGTIWMQQVLIQIMDAAHPERTEEATNRDRVPCLDVSQYRGIADTDDPFRERPDPRIFRTHLPPDMLPRDVKALQTKVVYVRRNPKDVLVSLYHYGHSYVRLEPERFEDFFQQFLEGNVYMGSWFEHVREFYAARDQLVIHFVEYENMLKDLRGEVVKLCYFLGEYLTDEAIDHVVERSTFKNMKTIPTANYKDCNEPQNFKKPTMRKGIAGDWKNHFTVAQNEQFDQVFKEKMNDFPLACTWELKQ